MTAAYAYAFDPDALERMAGVEPGAIDPAERLAKSLAWARSRLAFATRPPIEYPVSALGPIADACRALSSGAQVRTAMAGQSLLSVAALMAQSRANVRTIEAVKPLSAYFLTIGESGDGKSTADAAAKAAVEAKQRKEVAGYLADLGEVENVPKGEKRPPPPREPYRITKDGTVEGIRRGFAHGVPSQGCFSSEAAAMLAGYGMSPDHRSKTAATLNATWDDGEISVSRGTVGRVQLYDRRLSIHWMIQPEAAHEAMGDSLLSSIGFWPRFLLAWPEPSEPRRARPWRSDQDGAIADFWRTCTWLMEDPLGEDCGNLPVIEATPEAMALACRFFERMEEQAKGKNGHLREIKPFAVRATEQAFRLAGILAVFSGAPSIDANAMRNAISLASYSLEAWRSVFGDRDTIEAGRLALTLYRWLVTQGDERATEQSILHIGPKRLRSKARRDTALATLEQARLAYRDGGFWVARHADEDV